MNNKKGKYIIIIVKYKTMCNNKLKDLFNYKKQLRI